MHDDNDNYQLNMQCMCKVVVPELCARKSNNKVISKSYLKPIVAYLQSVITAKLMWMVYRAPAFILQDTSVPIEHRRNSTEAFSSSSCCVQFSPEAFCPSVVYE